MTSYAADVYTLVGGGMGVRLRDEPTSGTTRWLDFPDRVQHLGPDEAVRRTATVTVPHDTAPGQYLAALVIENDQPLAADGELSVEQVVRQALAVNITVPGPATPALAIGDADHTLAGGRSVARLEVDNPGNGHLKPAGTLTLTDDAGTVVASRDLTMDSIYAGTTAHLELALDEPLTPGAYTLSAALSDAEFGVDAVGSGRFEIAAPPLTERLVPGLDGVPDAIEATGLPLWAVLAAALLLVVIVVLVVAALRRSRARRRAAPTTAPAGPARPTPTAALDHPSANDPEPPPLFDPIARTEVTATRPRHTPRTTTPAPPVPPPPPAGPRPRHATVQRPAPRPAAPPTPRPTAPPPQPVPAANAPRTREQASHQPANPVLFTARTPPRRRRRSP